MKLCSVASYLSIKTGKRGEQLAGLCPKLTDPPSSTSKAHQFFLGFLTGLPGVSAWLYAKLRELWMRAVASHLPSRHESGIDLLI